MLKLQVLLHSLINQSINQSIIYSFIHEYMNTNCRSYNFAMFIMISFFFPFLFLIISFAGIESFLQTILRFLDGCSDPFTSQNVACSFYGLQNFGGDMIQIESLLEMLVKKIKFTPRKKAVILKDQELSMSLF